MEKAQGKERHRRDAAHAVPSRARLAAAGTAAAQLYFESGTLGAAGVAGAAGVVTGADSMIERGAS